MNHFAGFTTPVVGGHHAMLRFAEDGQAEPVLAPGGRPAIFPTEAEAWKAVTESWLKSPRTKFDDCLPRLKAA